MKEEKAIIRPNADEIREISYLVKNAMTPYPVSVNPNADTQLVVINGEVLNLSAYLPTIPARKRAAVTLTSIESFIDYINAHKRPSTAMFFNTDALTCTAVIDYHGQGQDGTPEFCQHVATLKLKETDSWRLWKSSNNKGMSQVEFALFIETMMADITNPMAADVLEMAKGLEATGEMRFKSRVVLEDGNQSFVYENNVNAKAPGSIEIPKAFELSIKPFIGADRSNITARFVYRIPGGNLQLSYMLIRPEEFILAATETAMHLIGEKTGIIPYIGLQPTNLV